MTKEEYKKQLKRLIKKFHPDLCNNIYLESAYNEITRIFVKKLNALKENENTKIEKINNHDYLYYKSGIKYYRNIHPDKFYKRNTDSTYEIKKYDELLFELNKIYLSFNLSEYFFNELISEYPESPYYQDSKEKIKLLKKLHKSYENILLTEKKIINNEKYMNEMGLNLL